MAALLRSARFLKLSSSPLLRVNAFSRVSPVSPGYSTAACRRVVTLYPGLAGSEAGGLSRFFSCSSTGPYVALRCYSAAVERKGELKDEPSVAVRTKQAQQFDWALTKLDSSVRRTGRVTKTLIQRIFHDVCRTGFPSSNQALLLLRSCGSLLPEMPLEERSQLAHRIWEKLQELGAAYDVSHYNALLKVYLQNEYKFSPTDFLAKMEEANVQPNRVTYQRLIAAYCQNGDIEGASKILDFMKNKDLPITEAVFNSLVTGHSRAGDMESAENILSVMRGAGIEPGADTYLALLIAYAEQGDIVKIQETLNTAESKDASLMDRDLMQIIFSLAKAGHQQYVTDIVERMRHERGYVPDAMNLCLSLTTQGYEDTAFMMLKNFPSLQTASQDGETLDMGNFFLRHCVNMNTSIEKLLGFCKELKDCHMHSAPLQFALYCALESKNTGLAVELMRRIKDEGFSIRPHYFWPLLTKHQKDKNSQETLEVLKAMHELSVHPDINTYSTYVLPTFASVDVARTAIKDVGCSVDTDDFLTAELRAIAISGDIAALYTLLSSPSFPAISLSAFRASLITGFRGSNDVESMAKITELFYKDSRFGQTNKERAENTAYFLFSLFDGMSETEVQVKEETLRQYLTELKNKNITIHVNIYRGIRNILNTYNLPELIKDVLVLVDKQSNEEEVIISDTAIPKGMGGKLAFLEGMLEEQKSQGMPTGKTLGQLIRTLCTEENLPRALELKTQYEKEMTPSCYALLINLCCRHDNLEEALNLKRELARIDSEAALDASKYIGLVRILSKHGRLDEAEDILKEMKEKNVSMTDGTITMLFHTLNSAALKGEVSTVRRLQDCLFTLGLVKPISNLCSPLVSAHLESGDLAGALEASMDCQKQYNQLPRIHDVICRLVEKGDTELLQKAMDFVSQERGEMTMLYDLFFAFLQTGRYKEARKIIETPGLRARAGRLQWFAEKCIAGQQMEPLENMVDMTAKLFECDRDEMYHYMLRLCQDANDWIKAEAIWTKMQEENVIPRERTLRLLADILRTNNQEVPFEVPEVWYEQPEDEDVPEQTKREGLKLKMSNLSLTKDSSSNDYNRSVVTLSKRGKLKEACNIIMETDRRGVTLGPSSYDSLIKALLAVGSLEDAMTIKDIASKHIAGFKLSDMASNLHIVTLVKHGHTKEALATFKQMLQDNQVPSQLAITRLVQSLGSRGDIKGIQEVENMVKMLGTINLSHMVFVNNTTLAHINNGDITSAVEGLESMYTHSDMPHKNCSFVFRKVLEANNNEALDKLSAMAERLCNHFASYKPATDLFLQFVDTGRKEDAKFLLQRCAAVAEQKVAIEAYMSKVAQKPGGIFKVKSLLELLPDITEKEKTCTFLIKCYSVENDLPSAKACYAEMQAGGLHVNELTLKRLALLYKNAGEPVPFAEPPESFKFYADKLRASQTQSSLDE